MNYDYVKYSIRIENLALSEKMECLINNSTVISSVILEQQKNANTFEITFFLKESTYIETIYDNSFIIERNNVIDNIALCLSGYVSELRFEASFLHGEASTLCDLPSRITVASRDDSLQALKKSIQDNRKISPMEEMYRNALSVEDKITRFMLFYSILELYYDTQKEIDNYILGKNCDVEMRESVGRNGKNKKVTVFTYLRNGIGHMKDDIDLKKVLDEMSGCLPMLAKYTLEVIYENQNVD